MLNDEGWRVTHRRGRSGRGAFATAGTASAEPLGSACDGFALAAVGTFSKVSSPSSASTPTFALAELALEQLQRQLVDQLLLDHPLQRAGAVGRVVAEVAEQVRASSVSSISIPRSRTRPAS